MNYTNVQKKELSKNVRNVFLQLTVIYWFDLWSFALNWGIGVSLSFFTICYLNKVFDNLNQDWILYVK